MRMLFASAAVAAMFAAFAATVPAAAPNMCPSGGTPPPGSTVKGGLEVDGNCVVKQLTINGAVTVDPGKFFQIDKSRINGGITAGVGSEVDVDNIGPFLFDPTGNSSQINGDVTLDHPRDFDLRKVDLNGGLNVNGSTTGVAHTLCDSTVSGGVTINAIIVVFGSGLALPGGPCSPNTVNGTVNITNSFFWTGGNTIHGDLNCPGSTHVVVPPADTVTGQNNCY